MKTNILSLALSFLSVVAIAQKKEIRDAGKAVEKGSFAEAKTLLNQAEPLLSEANDSYKEDYYLFKGKAYVGTGENTSIEDLMIAAEAFKKAREMGNESAAEGLATVTNSLVQGAINDQNNQAFSKAADKLYTGYQLNNQDTLYLYYAASNEVSAGNYEKALKYYEELKDLGFTGIETQYVAINKETGEEEAMNKTQRDLMVKTGEYIKPEDRITEPKTGEIAKNIALIYIQQGEDDKAIAAIDAAKAANPGDISLLQSEADMYYRMGDKAKYKELMEGIIESDPNNPTLYYNLGVTSFEIGDIDTAISYYKKALELDPELADARLNIAAAILSREGSIVEEMNSLGMSKADTQKYDELSEKRSQIYIDALPYLEKVIENDSSNIEAMRTAMNIYYQIGEDAKADALQEKINQAQN
ncbi:tetratricopeptide repeat protein [Gillisia limnaea]|uniref:Tetratricopeptide TPR_1 repeat-containing protein n=1 Tax=Gillisia limnaea (strain DSM 15749 / LMG 21470 / R-8282) TaxID=865937 RepID=H2BYK7_GILLR|nr:tetratricopeptide repeat protein [Gillisia limnaea]EHQ01128.1 Tetratricopeptide TPR_1 repeat-containing protein [Gillisia limnaea DSM 15749]